MSILNDLETDSLIYKIPSATVQQRIDFLNLDDIAIKCEDLAWQKVFSKSGKLLRSSTWYTRVNCKCDYDYANLHFDANDFPPWLQTIAERLTAFLGFEKRPLNSCNLNKYEHGDQSVGFHGDDEKLFQTDDGCVNIVSLSLGATRKFLVKRNYELDKDAFGEDLANGDLLVMARQTQFYWQHGIGQEKSCQQNRINLTFRHISMPNKRCKLCRN